ncbi:ALG14 [Lepeophtheirus salmonis]|uniref:UDP-N-acetylglucosamine transferase subunit ALG14 n=1 Tax=Lepeophtheirus salmonis TaxID=72036 RepID=A0A7R8CD00_LEPSM|nr:ALG14 [Lepeophtheirus salmonis]CAF2776119.1 ALG14 [Lepeophtheirus salmonis]
MGLQSQDSDSNSIERLKVKDPEGHLIKTKRSRIVGQSYITSVFTTSAAFVSSFEILNKHKPELILCNGPGTCLPMVVLGWAYKKMGLLSSRTKIIYIESICRVKTLSLTAKLVGPFVDHTLVQWPELALRYPNTPIY